ncbi:DUF1236 domain-containing protein [Mesorhizobium sp. BAC0120]|uniref:DUF1236 domain-containing protein n=1 Tax=Mesorhizobium sp. BAC0120 TaxID=3090670 RepID=UPI00298D54A1|nr:DUF1236 domain-containing protein [Mesorhizobium sp. BAC0120]MDW6023870.1 DUF1236 domain-containing protein [Mesorhizobium sp. BAC0120]
MKTRLLPTITGFLLLAGTGVAAAEDIVITPEQDTVIREYVVKEHVEPVAPPPDFDVTVGATVPEAVEIRPLNVPQVETRYDYVILDNRTVLVDPGTRRIVHIIGSEE